MEKIPNRLDESSGRQVVQRRERIVEPLPGATQRGDFLPAKARRAKYALSCDFTEIAGKTGAKRGLEPLAVREGLRGKSYMSQGPSRAEIDCLRWQQKKLVIEDECLTARQREVLQLLAEGKVMKEIGGVLNMTPRTVACHKYRIMGVLGAKNSAELVKYTVRNHMVAALTAHCRAAMQITALARPAQANICTTLRTRRAQIIADGRSWP